MTGVLLAAIGGLFVGNGLAYVPDVGLGLIPLGVALLACAVALRR